MFFFLKDLMCFIGAFRVLNDNINHSVENDSHI